MSFWDNVKKFAQPYAEDDYDDYDEDDYDDDYDEPAEPRRAPRRAAAPAPASMPLMEEEDEEAVSYAINLIGDDVKAFDSYFSILVKNRLTEDIRSDVTDILRSHADQVKEKAKAFYTQGIATEYMLEILSRVKEREEAIFDLLLKEFRAFDNVATRAGYLAAYGDERALPYLLERIEDRTIGFVEFQELKYAIEALGGEYNEPRDFTADKDYLAVEAAISKTATDEIKS